MIYGETVKKEEADVLSTPFEDTSLRDEYGRPNPNVVLGIALEDAKAGQSVKVILSGGAVRAVNVDGDGE